MTFAPRNPNLNIMCDCLQPGCSYCDSDGTRSRERSKWLEEAVARLNKDKMERQEVFNAIDAEREYQDNAVKSGGTHIVKEFPLGSALSAIQHKLDLARAEWYGNVTPHESTMDELRKIAAICVQMGEQYGMKERESTI